MAQFIYLKEYLPVQYPTGVYFSSMTFDYIREVSSVISELFPDKGICLVVRGYSGAILAGGIAYLLKRRGRDVIISISRKNNDSHSESLDGITSETPELAHIIVIDDFIQSGKTLNNIVKDLNKKLPNIKKYDMLCISNSWNNNDITREGGNRGINKMWETNKNIASHFKYILCNNPNKRK